MKSPLLVALILLISNSLFAQAQNSLSEDSIKSIILDIKQVTENYPDSAIILMRELRKANPELSLDVEADLLKTEGAAAIYTRNLDTAIVKFAKSGDVYQQILDNYKKSNDTLSAAFFELMKSQSNIINNVGGVAYYQGNYEKAAEYWLKASKIQLALAECPIEAIRIKAFEDAAGSIDNIGAIYSTLEQFEKSLEYRKKAHNMIGHRLDRFAMRVKFNIARTYQSLGMLDSSFLYGRQIYSRADSTTMTNEYFAGMSIMGEYYLERNELDSVAKYLLPPVKFLAKSGGNIWAERHYQSMAKYYMKLARYDLALQYIGKSMALLDNTKVIGSRVTALKLSHDIYYQLAKRDRSLSYYQKSIDYLTEYIDLNDSLLKAQRFKEFNELQSKYESEQKEMENTFLKDQSILKENTISSQRIWILLIGILFTFSIVLLIFQIRSRRLLSAQKSLIQSQKNRLTELDASKSRFFANLSHDLRTPISLILGHLGIIGSDEGGYLSVKGQYSLKKSLDNTNKLLSLSDEIRDLTSLEHGQLKLHFSKVILRDYFQLLVSMFKSAAEIKGVGLFYNPEIEEEMIAHLDPKQFEKIIYNLLSNALKFTQKGDDITVKLTANEESFHFEITDTGQGIKEEQLPFIFDRYYQSAVNEYREVEGLGIGLSLVKELVQLHNGQIAVSSAKGVGTTFGVTVSKNLTERAEKLIMTVSDYYEMRSENFQKRLSNSDGKSENAELKNKEHTILIVDDNSDIREYIAAFLTEDYNIYYAVNGLEALELIEKIQLNLVITDLMMPVMDGFELLDSLNEKQYNLPVMVVSARTLSDDKERILDLGVNEIVAKPFDRKEFKLRVQNLLSAQNSGEHVFKTNKNLKKELQNDVMLKINSYLLAHITATKISVAELSDLIFASERKTFRLIKELTDKTPLEYIVDFRLNHAKKLLSNNEFSSVTELATAVGITGATRFAKMYYDRFGEQIAELIKKA